MPAGRVGVVGCRSLGLSRQSRSFARSRAAWYIARRVKAYLEYLELFEYFGRQGAVRLGREEFVRLDAEFAALARRLPHLSDDERVRLAELKVLLLRDKP